MRLILPLKSYLLLGFIFFFSLIVSLQASDKRLEQGTDPDVDELTRAFRKRGLSEEKPSTSISRASSVVSAASMIVPAQHSSPQLSESPTREEGGTEKKMLTIFELKEMLRQNGLDIDVPSDPALIEAAEGVSNAQPQTSSDPEENPTLFEILELLDDKIPWGLDLDKVRARQEALRKFDETKMRTDISVEIINIMSKKERLFYEIPAIRKQIYFLKKKRKEESLKLEESDSKKNKKQIEDRITQLTVIKNNIKNFLIDHPYLDEVRVQEDIDTIQDKILSVFPTLLKEQLILIPAARDWFNLKKKRQQQLTLTNPKEKQ